MSYPTLEQLLLFAKVAQTRSVTRAAEEAGITQPAATQHMRALERRIGVPLTERTGRTFRLTDAGEAVAGYAQQIVSLADQMQDRISEVRGIGRGRLNIGASTTVGECVLPGEIARFCEEYPGVEVRLQILHGHEVVERLRAYDLDLGFMGSRPRSTGITARPFRRDEIILAVAAAHPLAAERTLSPAMLAGYPWLLREAGAVSRSLATEALRRLRIPLGAVLEFGSNAALRNAALSGLGIVAVSRHVVAEDVAEGRVHVLNFPGWSCGRQFYMLRRKRTQPAGAERAFVDSLFAARRRRLPGGVRTPPLETAATSMKEAGA